jgi:hypothetical protein
MAQRITVALEDDLDGGPAEQTVRFAFGGADYESDLGAKNAAAFQKQLAPFLSTLAGPAGARPAGRSVPWQAVSAAAISGAWAKDHGIAGAFRPCGGSSGRGSGSGALQWRDGRIADCRRRVHDEAGGRGAWFLE